MRNSRRICCKFSKNISLILLAILCLFTSSCNIEYTGSSSTGKSTDGTNVTSSATPDGEQTGNFTNDYLVNTEEALLSLVANANCERIVIGKDIAVKGEIVFERAVDILVKEDADLESNGGFILIKSNENTDINIEVENGARVGEGTVLIDCPHARVKWQGAGVLSALQAERYINAASYNDINYSGLKVGGIGKTQITEIDMLGGSNSIDDVKFEQRVNVITVYVPLAVSDKVISNAALAVAGDNCKDWSIETVDGKKIENAKGLSTRQEYLLKTVDGEANTRGYFFNIQRKANNIPVMYIYTDGNAAIDSKDEYRHGVMSIDVSGSEKYAANAMQETALNIRGRGNASWNYTDKKAYRIKFDEKTSVLGLEADKDWVLVSNYYDKSLVRNIVAHNMAAQMDYLYYTPTHISVDLFINGEYRGVYTVSDKIEVSNEKINIDTNRELSEFGFLIEIGWDFDSPNVYGQHYFDTGIIKRLYVKEPEIESKYGYRMDYIMNYVNKTDDAILSGEGYEQYIDVNSMVDWFIISELTNNTDGAFNRSCYFYKPENGKITMGPVWDFDMAFGNHYGDIDGYDGWATAEATYDEVNDTWTTYLIKDEAFMERVRTRWNEKKDVLLKTAEDSINEFMSEVAPSANENFIMWNILNQQVGGGDVDYGKYNTHALQVEYVREFVKMRAEWITNELNK